MYEEYEELIKLVRRAGMLGSVGDLMDWDTQTMMPKGAIMLREEQFATIRALQQEQETNPRIGKLLAQIDRLKLSSDKAANVREIEIRYRRLVRIPASLADEAGRLEIQGHSAWAHARKTNDFATHIPLFEKIINVMRKKAACIDPNTDPYDVLLQYFEPGASSGDLTVLFNDIKSVVVPLVSAISCSPAPDMKILLCPIPEERQMSYLRSLAKRIGYDFAKGRLDIAEHPFCASYGRITTRFTDGWWKAVSSVMHEAGHGKYEHNLPIEHVGTPLGSWRSMGVHESQSRLLEAVVGQSLAFWRGEFDKLKEAYAPVLDTIGAEEFYRIINAVTPGFIRVNADELTYPLHIILRFEIEQALIRGELAVKDLPKAWNAKMEELLGIVPPTNTLGCLQDPHWWALLFGYFPTYTIGNALAAQLWNAARKVIPSLEEQVRVGNFSGLDVWLWDNVHKHGCRYNTSELISRATGEPLNANYYTKYLENKFKALYCL